MTSGAKLCAFEVGVFAGQGEGGDEESVTWTWLALAHSDFSFYVFAWCLILCGIHLYWACVFWFAENGNIQFFDFSTPATRHRNSDIFWCFKHHVWEWDKVGESCRLPGESCRVTQMFVAVFFVGFFQVKSNARGLFRYVWTRLEIILNKFESYLNLRYLILVIFQ